MNDRILDFDNKEKREKRKIKVLSDGETTEFFLGERNTEEVRRRI